MKISCQGCSQVSAADIVPVQLIANVTDDIVTALDGGYETMLVLLDFSRAFDCINIELL